MAALADLRITNMAAKAKGSVEVHGTNLQQKAGLNSSILDAAWGGHCRELSANLAWRGGRDILVNRTYTSQTSRVCAHALPENRMTESVFRCVARGHTEKADTHAAKNILASGHAVWPSEGSAAACGGEVSRATVARLKRAAPWQKQEPTEARATV